MSSEEVCEGHHDHTVYRSDKVPRATWLFSDHVHGASIRNSGSRARISVSHAFCLDAVWSIFDSIARQGQASFSKLRGTSKIRFRTTEVEERSYPWRPRYKSCTFLDISYSLGNSLNFETYTRFQKDMSSSMGGYGTPVPAQINSQSMPNAIERFDFFDFRIPHDLTLIFRQILNFQVFPAFPPISTRFSYKFLIFHKREPDFSDEGKIQKFSKNQKKYSK